MSRFKVLVTDYEYDTLEYERGVLSEIDARLLTAQCETEDEVISAARGVDGLLVQYAPVRRRAFAELDDLRVVARYGIGVDTLDIGAATENGVCVVNVPDYCIDEVADHALALLLAASRKICLLNSQVEGGGWDYKAARPVGRLRGQSLGLLGFGRIPRRLAEKVRPLGLRVLAHDPFIDQDLIRERGVEPVGLDQLLAGSDFISIHVPLNDDTRQMISTREFGLMRDSVVLINTARGPIIDEKELIGALREGEVAGAALDVTEVEPLPQESPLRRMEEVLITPHSAFYSEESQVELQTRAARGVADVLVGRRPENLVNPEVWEGG